MGAVPDFNKNDVVPVRFGGPGSTSSQRDCIIIGEFTPQTNKIVVKLKGIGIDPVTKIDSRGYAASGALNLDYSIIGVVGRARWDLLFPTQPEAALALHRNMSNDGEDYSTTLCICETGEVRHNRQHEGMTGNFTLENDGQSPAHLYDFFQYEELSGDLEWTVTLEKIPDGSTRTDTHHQQAVTNDQGADTSIFIKVEVDSPYLSLGPVEKKTWSYAWVPDDGGAFEGNAYVFIGNPYAFFPNPEVNGGGMPGVKVLSVEYFDSTEPQVTAFATSNCPTYELPVIAARATDNVGVVAYMTTVVVDAGGATQPAADDAAWAPYPPSFAVVPEGVQAGSGIYEAFLWVKDAAGNINTAENAQANSGRCTVTLPG